RELITVQRQYFVAPAPTGNDANNGLTAGAPFATIQKAIDTAASIDLTSANVIIRLADGTYAVTGNAMFLKSYTGAGPVAIVGNNASPQNVIVSATSGDCIIATTVLGKYIIQGMTLRANTAGFNGVRASGAPTNIDLTNIRWDIALIQLSADYGASL